MDNLILQASRNIKKSKKKPTYDLIRETVARNGEEFEEDTFMECFNELVSNGSLVNIKPNDEIGSYHVCDELSANNVAANNIEAVGYDENNETDIIGMIKNVMLNEKISTIKNIKSLEEEVLFLKAELNKRNDVIDKLLDIIKITESRIDVPVETIPQRNDVNNVPYYENNLFNTNCDLIDGRNQFYHNDHPITQNSEESNLTKIDHYDINNRSRNISISSSKPDSLMKVRTNCGHNNNTIDSSNNSEILEHNDEISAKRINDQLQQVRIQAKEIYRTVKENNIAKEHVNKTKELITNVKQHQQPKYPWNKDTCLVIGDSTILGLQEKRMGGKFKVRGHSGAIVNDIYHHIIPLVEKSPTYIVLMIGTNDSHTKNADEIINEVKELKLFIEELLPKTKIIISCPTKRIDNEIAGRTVFDLRKKFINLNIPLILNDNILEDHLGKGGLHLNAKGCGRLALNIMNYIRRL